MSNITPGTYRAMLCPEAESKFPVLAIDRKPTGTLFFNARWKLIARRGNGSVVGVAAETPVADGLYITSYTCLINTNGEANKHGMAIVRHPKLFGWDGRSFNTLTDMPGKVEAILEIEEDWYKQKPMLKVRGINTLDGDMPVVASSSIIKKGDVEAILRLDREYAAILGAPSKEVDDLAIEEENIPF